MALSTKFAFDREFQIGIIALMVQNFDFLITASELVQPRYFEDQALLWTFQVARDYYMDHKVRPTVMVLENELRKALEAGRVRKDAEPSYRSVIDGLGRVVEEKNYLINEVVRFCRRQEVRRVFLETASLTESEDSKVWDEIEGRVRDACNVGAHAIDIGTQYFLQYQERLRLRALDEELFRMPTGIPELDYKLGGGLEVGQLGVWMGGTNSGKSIALPHVGKRAVFGGFKVAHYTLELSEAAIAIRYDSSWTGVPVHDLRAEHRKVDERLKAFGARYGNALIIKEYPTKTATVGTLRAHLMSLRNLGFVPDLVVVDYGDLLKPVTTYDKKHDALGDIFEELRGLAGEMKVPLWTATQLNRPGFALEVADVDSIADSYQKAMVADVIIAICANREELIANDLRLFIAKNRNGPAKHTVKIKSAYNRMCFYDPVSVPPAPQAPPPPAHANGAPPGMPARRAARRKPSA